MKDAAQVEETRFNNINSRAIALLSASSLVTAPVGVFAKDLPDPTKLVHVRGGLAAAVVLSLVGLVTSVAFLVVGVLLPTRRLAFGGDDNLVVRPLAGTDPRAVAAAVYVDYWWVLDSLQARNAGKVKALHNAYLAFGFAVAVIAAGTAYVSLDAVL